jgi:hypothetical protein
MAEEPREATPHMDMVDPESEDSSSRSELEDEDEVELVRLVLQEKLV